MLLVYLWRPLPLQSKKSKEKLSRECSHFLRAQFSLYMEAHRERKVLGVEVATNCFGIIDKPLHEKGRIRINAVKFFMRL